MSFDAFVFHLTQDRMVQSKVDKDSRVTPIKLQSNRMRSCLSCNNSNSIGVLINSISKIESIPQIHLYETSAFFQRRNRKIIK